MTRNSRAETFGLDPCETAAKSERVAEMTLGSLAGCFVFAERALRGIYCATDFSAASGNGVSG